MYQVYGALLPTSLEQIKHRSFIEDVAVAHTDK